MLQGHMDKTSQTSSKPPSSDSPFKKPKRRKSSGTGGAKQGHPDSGPTLLEPTDVPHLYPAPCSCGHGQLATPMLYHTHQVIELPPIDMQITHFLLPQAPWVGCGSIIKADVPSQYATGYGPRLSGLLGELSGMHGTSRRLIVSLRQPCLTSPR
jgi:transposase